MKHILSYGGGVNSSALFFYLLDKNLPLNVVIFADTGEEENSTYQSVQAMKEECKKHNIQFVTVKSSLGRLVDYFHSVRAIPSIVRRDCTYKFKILPIRQWLRKTYGKKEEFGVYIAYTIDEVHRAKESDVKYCKNIHPFLDDKIYREDNLEMLRKYNFSASKSGCKGCMFQAKEKWRKLLETEPKEFYRWMEMEENCSRYPRITITGKPYSTMREFMKATKEQTTLADFGFPTEICTGASGCFL